MLLTVRLFAGLRDRAGSDTVELELPDGAQVKDALAALDDIAGDVACVLAVNREYAAPSDRLNPGDELALIPPVSGGAQPHVRITTDPISLDALIEKVRDPRAGAIVTFSGITRDVSHLDYEAYAEMAEPVLREIVENAIRRHRLCAATAEHRIGRVGLQESSVVVATSSPHRPEAFAAAREIIDTLKATAPIWKSEEGEWVQGTPPVDPYREAKLARAAIPQPLSEQAQALEAQLRATGATPLKLDPSQELDELVARGRAVPHQDGHVHQDALDELYDADAATTND